MLATGPPGNSQEEGFDISLATHFPGTENNEKLDHREPGPQPAHLWGPLGACLPQLPPSPWRELTVSDHDDYFYVPA